MENHLSLPVIVVVILFGHMKHWLTFLQSNPDLREISDRLGRLAEFDSINFPSSAENDIFELKCRLCNQLLFAESVGLELRPHLLTLLIDEVKTSDDAEAKQDVISHLQRTKFVIRSSTNFNPDCDCTFRFHQIVARDKYLWYTDGQFADEVAVWLTHRLSSETIAG